MTESGGRGGQQPGEYQEINISRVIAEFPETIAVIFKRLMRAPRRSREEMRRRVSGYIVQIESLAREVDYLDVDLAQYIANACHRLIDTLDGFSTEDHRCLVQAAVLYFVTDEDAEGDTSSLIGFDDDRLVAETVWRELVRAGLIADEA